MSSPLLDKSKAFALRIIQACNELKRESGIFHLDAYNSAKNTYDWIEHLKQYGFCFAERRED